MPDTYRQAASLLVLRPSPDGRGDPDMLLVHKPRKKDAWQLPQGGCEEGESIEQAALRELQEEAGISRADILGASMEVYKYDFPPSFRRFRPDQICGQRIAFVFAVVEPDTAVKVDRNEIDGYQWVDLPGLRQYVAREEYLRLVERLYREALEHFRARSGR